MSETEKQGFNGLVVVAFENRMTKEMEELIARHGGMPKLAAAIWEIPYQYFDSNEHPDSMRFQHGP